MGTTQLQNFYVTQGTLPRGALSYVRRQADEDLYVGLTAGELCYVLTSRQLGKSSLMVRTATRLRESGADTLVLDLTAVGQNLSVEQWYFGMVDLLGQQLDIEDELEGYWVSSEQLSSLQRWMQAIREIILRRCKGRVVIFIDEIDAVRSLPFPTDEFFAGIREFYNRRAEDPELNRLTFCLLGVATPSDLIRDTRTTPFNIGRRIELTDFTEQEAATLIRGLGRAPKFGARLLRHVLYWTGGHPYLTQRLCLAVAEDESLTDETEVDQLCEDLFLSDSARERDDNLLFVRDRLLHSELDTAQLLTTYNQILDGRLFLDNRTDPALDILKLSGVITTIEDYIEVRNRIYASVFDKVWVSENLPDAEARRQQEAYRRGEVRATAVTLSIVAGLSLIVGLAFYLIQAQTERVAFGYRYATLSRDIEELKRENARLRSGYDRARFLPYVECVRKEIELENLQAELTRLRAQRRAGNGP